MELAINLHLGGLFLSNIVSILGRSGFDGTRSTLHDEVQKVALEPRGGRYPAQNALDETVIKVNGERFWLVAAMDPYTNVILHGKLYPARNTALIKMFLRELQVKHAIDDAESSSMAPP